MLCSGNIVIVAIVTVKLWAASAHIGQQQNANSKNTLQFKTLNVINIRSKKNNREVQKGKRSQK